MNQPRGKAFRRIVSLLVASALAGTPVLSTVPYAYAASPPESAPAPAASVAEQTSSAAPLPAGAVEVPERRTAYASHYRLPDGSYMCDLSAARVNYKTADGAWRKIDSNLVASAPGVSRNAANDFKVEFDSAASGRRPVRIANDDWSVELEPLFGLANAHFDAGNKTSFAAVARDVDLDYDVGPDGVKETVVLHSAAAPTTFSFKLSTTGLDLRSDKSGWTFYRKGGFSPQLVLGDLAVTDAAGADCASATIAVSPLQDGAIVTYSLPPAWLASPSRAFPVEVDPSLYVQITAVSDTPGRATRTTATEPPA